MPDLLAEIEQHAAALTASLEHLADGARRRNAVGQVAHAVELARAEADAAEADAELERRRQEAEAAAQEG